ALPSRNSASSLIVIFRIPPSCASPFHSAVKHPFSSRFAYRQRPVPSQSSAFARFRFFDTNRNTSPESSSLPIAVLTSPLSASNALRMSTGAPYPHTVTRRVDPITPAPAGSPPARAASAPRCATRGAHAPQSCRLAPAGAPRSPPLFGKRLLSSPLPALHGSCSTSEAFAAGARSPDPPSMLSLQPRPAPAGTPTLGLSPPRRTAAAPHLPAPPRSPLAAPPSLLLPSRDPPILPRSLAPALG